MIDVQKFVVGKVQTNCYLVTDTNSGDCVVIDPGAADDNLINYLSGNLTDIQIKSCWFTHAHFDHVGGISQINSFISPPPVTYLHQLDLPLWRANGGAHYFGMSIDLPISPNQFYTDYQSLNVGAYIFTVLHTPGHTPGSVVFFCKDENLLFSGDLLFRNSIGRTDLPGGDYAMIMESIGNQILSLPDETRVFPGHGEETTIGIERIQNPFISRTTKFI
ncbi:MAG: MBL fold metallo-hydrolase [Anaerolineales bacterium]|nr:MBL fold metallo-hydrolase [Anaerolineales bacterium]